MCVAWLPCFQESADSASTPQEAISYSSSRTKTRVSLQQTGKDTLCMAYTTKYASVRMRKRGIR